MRILILSVAVLALAACSSMGSDTADHLNNVIDHQQQMRDNGQLPVPQNDPEDYQDFRT